VAARPAPAPVNPVSVNLAAPGLTAAAVRATRTESFMAGPARCVRGRLTARGFPAASRDGRHPGPPGLTAASERENHQHDQAERNARYAHIQPEASNTGSRMLGHKPHDGAQDHQDDTEHDRHRTRDRQGDD